MKRQHRNGVSPRNQSFHEHNGSMIMKIVGVLLLACMWPLLMKIIGWTIFVIVIGAIFYDLWSNI